MYCIAPSRVCYSRTPPYLHPWRGREQDLKNRGRESLRRADCARVVSRRLDPGASILLCLCNLLSSFRVGRSYEKTFDCAPTTAPRGGHLRCSTANFQHRNDSSFHSPASLTPYTAHSVHWQWEESCLCWKFAAEHRWLVRAPLANQI